MTARSDSTVESDLAATDPDLVDVTGYNKFCSEKFFAVLVTIY
jgi:hypothetical protein